MRTNEDGRPCLPAGRAHLALQGLFALAALVVLPLAMLYAADITPGYTFASGEANVTHTKLNNSAAGTINTSFYSGKGSAGGDPNTAFEFLLRDTTLDTFKRTTLLAAIFDHTALLSARTAKTSPVVADLVFIGDSAAGNAYKQMTWTNWMFSGTSTTAPTNETLLPALRGGLASSLNLSNLVGGLTSHSVPTNGDLLMTLTENGRALKSMTLQALVSGAAPGTNWGSDHMLLAWDGTRLRSPRGTNLIDGVVTTNSTPTTNDAFITLQAGQLKKLFLHDLRGLMRVQNIVQSTYTSRTNIAGSSGNWSNVTALGSSSLSNNITPSATASKILVRLVLSASAAGNSQPGAVRVIRDATPSLPATPTPIGIGDSDASNRTEASAPIPFAQDPLSVVWEWLDSPAATNAVKYYIEVKATTSTSIYINRSAADTDNENNVRVVSSLTLTEVFQ